MELIKEFGFESAHHLPYMPPDHKCRRVHGHSYKMIVSVRGPVGSDGIVMDFSQIKDACAPIIEALDHRDLNTVPGLENPTAENIAVWVWDKLWHTLPGLYSIMIRETCTSACIYYGPASEKTFCTP